MGLESIAGDDSWLIPGAAIIPLFWVHLFHNLVGEFKSNPVHYLEFAELTAGH